jgi:hypothetical protein
MAYRAPAQLYTAPICLMAMILTDGGIEWTLGRSWGLSP